MVSEPANCPISRTDISLCCVSSRQRSSTSTAGARLLLLKALAWSHAASQVGEHRQYVPSTGQCMHKLSVDIHFRPDCPDPETQTACLQQGGELCAKGSLDQGF